MSDRAVQDGIIRYLADASARGRASAPIPAGEAAKAARFAHFLARRYYRDRLARSFRYSHRFFSQTGRTAEQLVDGAEFNEFLSACVMGSLASAQCVGEMVRAHLCATLLGPWWPDLLDYEYCYFLQAATAEHGIAAEQPSRGLSAVCRRFAWALPEMLPRLRAGELIGNDLQRETTLLFSRTHAGRIYVVEVEPALGSIFCAVDGLRTVEQIAHAAGVSTANTRAMLASLANIGAVEFLS
jgi:hypothetical protein